uniref:Uncharacterized protein n=1 Tax=Panagrolaimus sp. PS1159 TaxID=55785 RepID=A0AC35F947_9BILA
MPVNEMKNDGPWNFKFTKDAENPVLIDFEKWDGSRGAASPAFLLAMLLKEHLKAIKDETGEKPNDLFIFLLNFTNANQERIKENLEEAGKLLKINISLRSD